MKRVKISGGPAPRDIKIELVDNGAEPVDITDQVLAFEYTCDAQVKLTMFAELDNVEAES